MPVPPPPFGVSFTDRAGNISIEWSRFLLASQRTLAFDVAPADARYVTVTANPSLTDEENLGALSAGYLKQTVATGVADLSTTATIPATDLSGTIPDARFPSTLPAVSGANLTNLNATNLASGTVPDARFPATLPATNGSQLTNLSSSALTGALPAISGAALTAVTGTAVTHAVVTKTVGDSPYTVVSTDETILVNAVGGAVTITLPSATSGRILTVKKIDASGNAVTLSGTVDGAASPTLTIQWQSRILQGDGSNWVILGQV